MWPVAFGHIWIMEQFLCPFQSAPCSVTQKPHCKSAGISVFAESQQENKARARYQYSAGVCSPGRSATRSHVLSCNVSFSPDTQQGPDKLTQACWFQGCLIRNSKPRIWAASAEAQAHSWMLCELCCR